MRDMVVDPNRTEFIWLFNTKLGVGFFLHISLL